MIEVTQRFLRVDVGKIFQHVPASSHRNLAEKTQISMRRFWKTGLTPSSGAKNEEALSHLRDAEGGRMKNPVRHRVTLSLQFADEAISNPACIDLREIRDVLEDEAGGLQLANDPNVLKDQVASLVFEAKTFADDAKRLAGWTPCDQLRASFPESGPITNLFTGNPSDILNAPKSPHVGVIVVVGRDRRRIRVNAQSNVETSSQQSRRHAPAPRKQLNGTCCFHRKSPSGVSVVRPIQAHGLRSKVYGPVLLSIFRRKFKRGMTKIVFTLEEVREELVRLGLQARNAADVIYRMKSRTVLPAQIQKHGFRILEVTSRGVYALTVGESTLIDYVAPVEGAIVQVMDRTPPAVQRLFGEDFGSMDEQGFLSVLRYNDLISHFLGAPSYHVKSHVRRSVPGVGQAEVDDVHVALISPGADTGPLTIVPIEAKAKDDPVNRAQIAMQVRYALHAFPGLAIRPLTVKLFEDGTVLFMEFNASSDANALKVLRHAHYKIVRPALHVAQG